MAAAGFVFLVIGFIGALVTVVGLLVGRFTERASMTLPTRVGLIGVAVSFVALAVCCAILVFCFMTGDVSILYVLEERSLSSDSLVWLYKLSGLWAGRAGSLLFWTFLIALFNGIVLLRSRKADDEARALDTMAMMVIAIVVAVFCGVLLFSEGNMPFVSTPDSYFTSDGQLTAAASLYSMNQLLEHWAMALHPPMLFIGYAGLTVPFAYAMAALIVQNWSRTWVDRTLRFVLASWLFLGLGIGLGAAWAYVVLGWGGYWGWDPVENASLLSWLVCVALVHTLTVYRQRGAFKRWAIMCACLAFTFVIVATFITRSGIVQSVHAFAGDPVSLALFGGLIVVSLAAPIIGLVVRSKSLSAEVSKSDDIENMLSKNAAYYFNNLIMIVFTLLLTYMTLAPALPSPLPFAGESLGASAFEAISRPLGIVYLFILAICPLLSWGKTDRAAFLKQAKVPAICAAILFVLLMIYWATQLNPAYYAMLAKGNAASLALLEAGHPVYYSILAIAGLAVASLLFFTALFFLVRNVRAKKRRGAAVGGALAHVAMAIILIGLVGSSMYVTEETGYMGFDIEKEEATETFSVQEYELVYSSNSITDNTEASNTVLYQVDFDVYKDGTFVGQVHPSVQLNIMTQQQKLNASVLSFPDEDLFVVYRGVNQEGDFSLDVRVNPFISLVWVGFGLLMVGTLCALVMPRREGKARSDGGQDGFSESEAAEETCRKAGDERD